MGLFDTLKANFRKIGKIGLAGLDNGLNKLTFLSPYISGANRVFADVSATIRDSKHLDDSNLLKKVAGKAYEFSQAIAKFH